MLKWKHVLEIQAIALIDSLQSKIFFFHGAVQISYPYLSCTCLMPVDRHQRVLNYIKTLLKVFLCEVTLCGSVQILYVGVEKGTRRTI